MIKFDQFVASLGAYAKQYTPEQLEQLHVDVQKLAQVLLAVHEAKVMARKKQSSPQPDLDESGTDRTIKKKITEHADASTSSHTHAS